MREAETTGAQSVDKFPVSLFYCQFTGTGEIYYVITSLSRKIPFQYW